MKTIKISILALISAIGLSSCEDVISLDVKDGISQLVVDGWLTNKQEDQVIKLTLSQAYFDNTQPAPALGATVIIFESDSTAHELQDLSGNGEYVLSKEEASFLKEGEQYALYIKYQDESFAAISSMNRVPKIDSINYEYFEFPFEANDDTVSEGYLAQFYAYDPEGEGDAYWIRTTKNGKFLNSPSAISTAYDAGFSVNSKSDGLMFIQPIRQSINDGLYINGDSVKVELWSITLDAYFYLLQVQQVSSNGGLFATPLANIPSNIFNLNTASEKKALGFFGISQVSTFSTVIDSSKAIVED